MAVLKTMSTAPRTWSFPLRLITTALCFLLCGTVVGLGMWFAHLASFAALFCLPIILSSWFFKQRGTFICVGSVLLILATLNTLISGSVLWFPPMRVGFIIGGTGYLIIGLFISFLAHTLDITNQARVKAQQAEERLHQLYQVKDQFLLNVSHELRTPLTQIRGYLELLSAHGEQLDEAKQKLFLDYALRGCDELEALVKSVLDAAETTSGVRPPRCETLLVAEVLRDVLAQFDPQTREAYAIHFEQPQTLAIWADRQYIRQVLRNLLSNAFKYSPVQTAIEISATLDEGAGTGSPGIVRLSIKDSGPGIPPGELSLLFEKFVRLKRDLGGSTPGTGLGLYISKQLVEAMGGRIWVESAGIPGQGSRFSFTLPRVLSSD